MKNHLISSQSWKRLLLPALVAGSLLALPASMRATLPITGSSNLSVIFGSATFPAVGTGTSGGLNITSTSANTVLGWVYLSDNSNAGAGDAAGVGGYLSTGDVIDFIHPSASSAVLNLVTGSASTIINGGALTSNGKILILNPNGITINSGSTVNAAAFYASTVPETLTYFETNGNLQVFSGTPPATATTGAISVAERFTGHDRRRWHDRPRREHSIAGWQ